MRNVNIDRAPVASATAVSPTRRVNGVQLAKREPTAPATPVVPLSSVALVPSLNVIEAMA
jgi:hypothetical protein